MISRRSLFGFLAAAPVGAVAAVKAAAEPAVINALPPGWAFQCVPEYDMTASEVAEIRAHQQRTAEWLMADWQEPMEQPRPIRIGWARYPKHSSLHEHPGRCAHQCVRWADSVVIL